MKRYFVYGSDYFIKAIDCGVYMEFNLDLSPLDSGEIYSSSLAMREITKRDYYRGIRKQRTRRNEVLHY